MRGYNGARFSYLKIFKGNGHVILTFVKTIHKR